ncbi:MAG: heliorhodopsin HeR [Bacilli bacterium]|nr:heliorhodopsin HeR [Bacilli bacterium]
MDSVFQKLRRFNLIMGAFHLIQGILMVFMAYFVIDKLEAFQPTIVQNYLTFVPGEGLVLTGRELFTLPFGILVALFLFLSAFAHFLISLPNKVFNVYVEDLKKGINKFRWFEYAISSSIMIVLTSVLFGVVDIASLLLIFVVNASMNLFGLVMEQMNAGFEKGKVKWGPFIWGAIAGITPWIVVGLYIFGSGSVADAPWFAWAILASYFFAFNAFPFNMVAQYLKIGKWKDYLYGEKTYIVLSLVAKSILAWLVLFGAMQP